MKTEQKIASMQDKKKDNTDIILLLALHKDEVLAYS